MVNAGVAEQVASYGNLLEAGVKLFSLASLLAWNYLAMMYYISTLWHNQKKIITFNISS